MRSALQSIVLVIIMILPIMSGCLSEENESHVDDNSKPTEYQNELTLILQESYHILNDTEISKTITSEVSAGFFYAKKFDNYDSIGAYMNHARWNEFYPIEIDRLVWERVTFDKDGIPLVEYDWGIVYVPTTAFHWGLLSYSKWLMTSNISYFEDAQKVAKWAIVNQTEFGTWDWNFDYTFSDGSAGKLLSGWPSAMTQGLGMSFLSRMYHSTGDSDYLEASIKAIKPFQFNVKDGGVKREINNQNNWYELYPTPSKGSYVLNGFLYSLIGLYDNWKTLNSVESKVLYDNGIETLKQTIGYFDLGCASSYDILHFNNFLTPPNVARKAINNLHVSLLSILNIIEDNSFQEIQNRFYKYAKGECISSPNGAENIVSQYHNYNNYSNILSNKILLFENYNHSNKYMNHHNWNGSLWDRVVFDEHGIPKVQYSDGIKYVPTTTFHWGLVQYSKWIETQDTVYFENATKIANWAVENQSQYGGWAWFFDHSFHGGVLGSMDSGWFGGMTQGLGMSFLARMYNATGNQSYMDAALNSTQLLSINVSDGGVLRHYQNYSWYEEYPTPDAGSFVLNGYIYTLIGLYDLIQEFNDSISINLYQDGILSLSAMIGLFDLGCASSYDLVYHSVSGTAPNVAREGYHNTHITLISVMNAIDNENYQSVEDRWIEYANGVCYSSPNGANPR